MGTHFPFCLVSQFILPVAKVTCGKLPMFLANPNMLRLKKKKQKKLDPFVVEPVKSELLQHVFFFFFFLIQGR